MIIDHTEKNRILKLYGLINENNIIYEETTTLTKDTEFDVSGTTINNETKWYITYKASDRKFYPISLVLKDDTTYKEYTGNFSSKEYANNGIRDLKTKLPDKKNEPQTLGLNSDSTDEKNALNAQLPNVTTNEKNALNAQLPNVTSNETPA